MDAGSAPAAAVAYCSYCDLAFCAAHLIEHDPRCGPRGEPANRRPDPHSVWLRDVVPCSVCAGILMADRRPLEERLGCRGFFGFGSGYADALGWASGDGGVYCNGCPLAADCWAEHKARVRRLTPETAAAFDRFAEKYGEREAVPHFFRAQMAAGVPVPVEPYTAVMSGNVVDGRAVALDGRPAERGDFRLPWPFPLSAKPAGKPS